MNSELQVSSRTSRDENFPIASILLPKKIRPHVAAFYAFARAADDVADSPELDPAEKLSRLDGMERVLDGKDADGLPNHLDAAARALRQSLIESGVSQSHARDLLAAFRHDAIQTTTETWADLMAYCNLSASPVGRYLIALCGGANSANKGGNDEACGQASDALCAALQVLNHLQDIKQDYQLLGRVYLPQQWLQREGVGPADLGAPSATAGLRRVMDRTVAEVESLLVLSSPLGGLIQNASLAREAAGIHALASALCSQLKRRDPLAERVELGKLEMAWRFMLGALRR